MIPTKWRSRGGIGVITGATTPVFCKSCGRRVKITRGGGKGQIYEICGACRSRGSRRADKKR